MQNESQQRARELFEQISNGPETQDCIHEDALWDYVTGEVHDPDKARLELHMKDCKRCYYQLLKNKSALGQWEPLMQELDRIEIQFYPRPTTFAVSSHEA